MKSEARLAMELDSWRQTGSARKANADNQSRGAESHLQVALACRALGKDSEKMHIRRLETENAIVKQERRTRETISLRKT